MGLTLITPPVIEPLTVAEVATHLRLDVTSREPVPAAPAVALANAGAGNVNAGAHRYRLTFLTTEGETDGGDVSDVVTVTATNGKVQLTNLPVGGPAVVARSLYRTPVGQATFFRVATIADNTSTTFVDNVADASLGPSVPTTNTTLDPQIASLIVGAREATEHWLRRALIEQKWRYTLESFPDDDRPLRLPMPPLRSIESVKYVAEDGTLTDLSPSLYEAGLDSLPGYLIPTFGTCWPTTAARPNAVRVEFVCGYGPARADVPEGIKQLMKLLITDAYENREAQIIGTISTPSNAVTRLVNLYRFREA